MWARPSQYWRSLPHDMRACNRACWHILAHVGAFWNMFARLGVCWRCQPHVGAYGHMLARPAVFRRVLAGTCRHVWPHACASWRMLAVMWNLFPNSLLLTTVSFFSMLSDYVCSILICSLLDNRAHSISSNIHYRCADGRFYKQHSYMSADCHAIIWTLNSHKIGWRLLTWYGALCLGISSIYFWWKEYWY